MSNLVLNCGNDANRAARSVLMSRRGFIRSAAGAAATLALPRAARADDLKTSLVSYWDLTETSGTREDAHGTNDLADNNTVLYSAEAWGNAADFEIDNSEYLEKSGGYAAGLAPEASDYSVSFWIKVETLPALYSSLGFCGAGVNWQIWWDREATPVLRLQRYAGGYTNHTVAYTLSAGTLYHIIMVWDHDDHTVEFYVNGSSIGTDNNGTTASQVTWNDPFRLGRNNYAYMDGIIGPTGFWSRKITSAEATSLYNSGTPLLYDELVPSAPATRRRVVIF